MLHQLANRCNCEYENSKCHLGARERQIETLSSAPEICVAVSAINQGCRVAVTESGVIFCLDCAEHTDHWCSRLAVPLV